MNGAPTQEFVCNSPEIAEYVATRAGCGISDSDTNVGIVSTIGGKARVLGGVVYTAHTGASCFVHAAGERVGWMGRDFLWLATHYPFVQLGYNALYSLTPEHNASAVAAQRRIGFSLVAVLPEAFASGHGMLLRLARAECRWHTIRPLRVQGNFAKER